MAIVGVQPESQDLREQAASVAKKLALEVLPSDFVGKAGDPGVKLLVSPRGLELAFVDGKRGKPYRVDFLTSTWRGKWLQGVGKQHIFRRALGQHQAPIRLLDGTAGFGQDALLAMTFGCQVTAVEQSPVVAALLQDGIERARRDDEAVGFKLTNLQVVQGQTEDYLAKLKPAEFPDVIYLDPMFEKPKKSAKSPKEMQLLQELMDHSSDEEQLLNVAMKATRNRVVVKRPLKGRAIVPNPSHSFKGQSVRYDVYLVK
jgi:16S rRNA (guanine1516-N2)-methyltransferase